MGIPREIPIIFPVDALVLRLSVDTKKGVLMQDGVALPQGRKVHTFASPFSHQTLRIQVRRQMYDPIPYIVVNGTKVGLVPPLTAVQNLFICLPMLMVLCVVVQFKFASPLLAVIGYGGGYICTVIFRDPDNAPIQQYLLCLLITATSLLVTLACFYGREGIESWVHLFKSLI